MILNNIVMFGLLAVLPVVLSQGGNPYFVSMVFSIPAYNIYEPIDVWYKPGSDEKQRMEYYGGVDTTILDNGMSYNIVPQYGTDVCSRMPAKWLGAALTDVIPDKNAMTFDGTNTVVVDNIKYVCDTYTLTLVNDSLTSKYTYYEDTTTGSPVQYFMDGYNTMFGSHYDQYVVTYSNYSTAPFPDSVFDLPANMSCPFMSTDVSNYIENYMKHPNLELARFFHSYDDQKIGMTNVLNSYLDLHPQIKVCNNCTNKDENIQNMIEYLRTNLHYINHINRQHLTYKVSLMQKPYSHLHISEIREQMGVGITNHIGRQAARERREKSDQPGLMSKYHTAPIDNTVYPAFNWVDKGAVTPIKDQGSCGSCWSFGSIEAMEGAYYLKYGKLIKFSAQYLMNCGWKFGNNGCNGGLDTFAYETTLEYDIATEDDLPYMMNTFDCKHLTYNNYQITGYVNVTSKDESALLDALATKGPISISIDVSDAMIFYSSGIFNDPACLSEPNDLDHAVLLVGMGYDGDNNNSPYWIVKNSWSTNWGEEGYIRITQENNQCGIATEPTYPLIK